VLAVLPFDPLSPDAAPRLGELPDPVPAAGEVLVAVDAAGVNRADLLQLRGGYPPPRGESAVPGLECCGRIVAVGPGVAPWREGDPVMALLGGGGHAPRVAVPAGQLMALPAELSPIEGGAVPEAGLTGWTNLVVEGELRARETVLVTGATGGMGSFAVQLARELGAHVLAVARRRERLERLRAFGIEDLGADDGGLPAWVRQSTGGRRADLVFDLAGGSLLPAHLGALRDGGRLVLIGLLAGRQVELDLGEVLQRRLRLIGSVLRARSREEKARLVAGFAGFALPRLAARRLQPVVDRVLPFEQVAEAYRCLASNEAGGKIVLAISPAATV
jgi:putative PIG3 family NAD(P)H quinone oxidoreductase